MNEVPEMTKAVHLDSCIERVLEGGTCGECPAESEAERMELKALVYVAEALRDLGRTTAAPEAARRKRIRRRYEGTKGVIRQIAFYRLPHLPPLWIKPEAC